MSVCLIERDEPAQMVDGRGGGGRRGGVGGGRRGVLMGHPGTEQHLRGHRVAEQIPCVQCIVYGKCKKWTPYLKPFFAQDNVNRFAPFCNVVNKNASRNKKGGLE